MIRNDGKSYGFSVAQIIHKTVAQKGAFCSELIQKIKDWLKNMATRKIPIIGAQ